MKKQNVLSEVVVNVVDLKNNNMNTKLAHIVMLDGDLTSPIMKNKKGDIGNIAAFRGEFPTPQHL